MVELLEAHREGQNIRYGAALKDGGRVEAVVYRGDTLCISTQVGCAVGCPFCASGAKGLMRPLSFEELYGQVQAVRDRGHELARITASGVGEPLHNHENVTALLEYVRGEGLKMSLTTSGGPLKHLRYWLAAPHNGLTLSVHAGTEATRARLVPKAPALRALIETLHDALPALTRHRKKKTALAYLLLAGDNDSDEEIDAFIALVEPLGLSVHLFAYNPVPTSDRRALSRARYEAIYGKMREAGLVVRMSSKARTQANGGCGTLVATRATP